MVTFRGWRDPRHHSTDFQTIGRFTKKTIPMTDEIVLRDSERSDARTTW
jgi:hypothetical protein